MATVQREIQPQPAGAAIDATMPDMYSGLAACGQLAETKYDEYAATIKFIGLLSGIGPDEQVEKARNDLKEAILNALRIETTAAELALSQNYREYLDASKLATIYDTFSEDEALVISEVLGRVGSMGHPGDLGAYTGEIAGGSRTPDLSQHLEHGVLSPEGAEYIRTAAEKYRQAVEIQEELNDARAERWAQWWQGIGEWFEKLGQMIKDGNIGLMLCTVLFEGVFMLVEEAVIWGATAVASVAIGAVTAGGGAVAAGITVQIIARSVQAGSRTARISLRAARTSGRRELREQSLARANTVDAGVIDASDMPNVNKLGDEDFDNGSLTPNDREDLSTPNDETPDTTNIDGEANRRPADKVPGDPHEVPCFNKPDGVSDADFMHQLNEQSDVLNGMSADLLVARRQAIHNAGGTSSLRDPGSQRAARDSYISDMTRHYRREEGLSREAAAAKAREGIASLDATHRLDIIAGGDPSDISGMNDKTTNRSMGPQWRGARSQSVEDYARAAQANGHGRNSLNVQLRKC